MKETNAEGGGRLPPLRGLVTFEMAARLGSFTKAAEGLGLTQPAVSHQIRRLEQHLGRPLFRRDHRGIALTEAGAALFVAVQRGLTGIGEAVREIRGTTAQRVVTIAADVAFSGLWLVPRLAEIKALLPTVELRIITSQWTQNINEIGADLGVLFGDGAWFGTRAELLVPEYAFPVCAPSLLKDGRKFTLEELQRLPLLHLEMPSPVKGASEPWFKWESWFAAAGLPYRPAQPGLSFNNYNFTIQAAIAGQGIALGWRPLVEQILLAGQLVPCADKACSSARGYHLLLPGRGVPGPEVQRFIAWLKTAMAKSPPVPTEGN
ncbi:MAG TPA: LysR substrate-binding domain-containing protein [Hypericibacter adhaerens]|jgi:putative choline sulfate-utilization transcription factor|uniref:LysR family transcriptional regulator n=1 Tax=Hypericibacter adhaerens TaxID=2602016 RepID=A0A5J6N5F6_9PROT|nr:LysR substrate-binding domain-containing protein [Hypericibacter adhaerens]QEX23903.1 LysR family transcriptional regulator [Hypericibacter adhaerens]HWA45187.1 LysR substrate-binding domain-containing protein [Hypericibacter adhaerens]